MRFIRRLSTARLVALIGAGVLVFGGAAIALAAGDDGPAKPQQKPLVAALADAAEASRPAGISGRFELTNNLLSTPGGLAPLAADGSGRFWLSDDGRFRLELQGENGDVQVRGGDGELLVYDASSNTVYTLPLPTGMGPAAAGGGDQGGSSSLLRMSDMMGTFLDAVDLTGPTPGVTAGQPSYTVRISPKHDGGLLGSVELAWDAARGIPLKVAVYSRGDQGPVLALEATEVSYGTVSDDELSVQVPDDATRVDLSLGEIADRLPEPPEKVGTLPFKLDVPDSLVGLERTSLHKVEFAGTAAAVVTYGAGLGRLVVLVREDSASDGPNLDQLLAVSIDGAEGRELATALGTAVQFSEGGLTYTLVGSLPAVAVEEAARAVA